jgi:hypothetical protein
VATNDHEALNLRELVIETMQGVLIHQRTRWGALAEHQRSFEGWWKAEFALALEGLAWRTDLSESLSVAEEMKPDGRLKASSASARDAVDLYVGAWDDKKEAFDTSTKKPAVWLELKERGLHWHGNHPSKVFGELAYDAQKWSLDRRSGPKDSLLLALVTYWKTSLQRARETCRASGESPMQLGMPKEWAQHLAELSRDWGERRSISVAAPRWTPPKSRVDASEREAIRQVDDDDCVVASLHIWTLAPRG